MSGVLLGLFFVGKCFTFDYFCFYSVSPLTAQTFCTPLVFGWGSFCLPPSPSPHSGFYCKVSGIKLTVDTVLALTEGRFQQRNSGLFVYNTALLSYVPG